jgi:hypothetical protein
VKKRARTVMGWLTSTPEGLDELERMFDKAKKTASSDRFEPTASDVGAEPVERQNL